MRSSILLFCVLGLVGCNVPSAGPSSRQPKDKKVYPVELDPSAPKAPNQNQPGAALEPPSAFDLEAFFSGAKDVAMPAPNGPNDSEGLPVSSSPVLGSDKALVTIFEFSDLQCPFCKKGNETIKQAVEKYGDQIRIVWKNFPLIDIHPNSVPAAAALMALQRQGNAVFWAAENVLFDNLSAWGGRGSTQMTPEKFESYLAQVPGINIEQWRSDLKDANLPKTLLADMKLADFAGVGSTPTFFVNGRKVEGAYPIEELSALIDAEIAAVKEEFARGTAPEAVFAIRMKANLVTPDTRFQVEATGPSFGAAEPKVTIVAFSDFQCPFCTKGDASLMEAVAPFAADVKIVYRNLPLTEIHPDAFLAAEAALAANEQGKYLEYHKKLFENQRLPDPQNERGRSGLTRPDLEKYAQDLGLNMEQFKSALDTHRFKDVIDRDMAVATAFNINGTPAYYINGKLLHGAYPAEDFKALIEKEMKYADELLAKGVPKANLYQEIMKTAYTPKP
jgi:protein-disulfide isomerase